MNDKYGKDIAVSLKNIDRNLKRIADTLDKDDRQKKLDLYLKGAGNGGEHDSAQPENL